MKKKMEIDFLNTIFCLLVIFIHVMSAPVTELDRGNLLYVAAFVPWRLSAFVVQGFIFLSGLKLFLGFTPGRDIDYGEYYTSRLKKIVLPYIICVILYYVYFCRNGYFENPGVIQLTGYIINGTLVSHFYFVIIIVQLYLLRPVWEVCIARGNPVVLLIVSAAVTMILPRLAHGFLYNDRIFTTYLIYWIGGCLAGAYYENFCDWAKKRLGVLAAVFAAAVVCEGALSFVGMTGRMNVGYLEEMHLIYCVCAILFTYSIALKAGEFAMHSRILREINGASYYIYLIHCLFIYIINDAMARFGGLSVSEKFCIRAVFTYTISVLVCAAYVNLAKCIKKRLKKA